MPMVCVPVDALLTLVAKSQYFDDKYFWKWRDDTAGICTIE